MGNNYLSSRSSLTSVETKVSIQKRKSRLDKPLEVKPVDDSTVNKPGHREPLLKTVQLPSNVGRRLPSETIAAQNFAHSCDMLVDEVLKAEEIITPVSESLPSVVSSQMMIVEEVSINPASLIPDECSQPVPMSVSIDLNIVNETVNAEYESLTMETESETPFLGKTAQSQFAKADNEIHMQEVESDTCTLMDENETQPSEDKDEYQTQEAENRIQDEEREYETPTMETGEAENKTETLETVTVIHNKNDGLVIEEITREFSIEEQIEEIMQENDEDSVDNTEGELEIQTENNVICEVNYENSDETTLNIVDEDSTAVVEVEETLLESFNIEKMIREEEDAQWRGHGDNRVETNILSAWDAIDSDSEKLLAEVNLSNTDEPIVKELESEESTKSNENVDAEMNNLVLEEVDEQISPGNQLGTLVEVGSTEPENIEVLASKPAEPIDSGSLGDSDKIVDHIDANPQSVEMEKSEAAAVPSNNEKLFLEDPISIEKIINDGEETWDKNREEQVQAAILAAALSVVDSSAEKLLTEAALESVSNFFV